MWMPGHELFHRLAIMNSCEKKCSAQLGLSSRVPKNEVQSILIYLIFSINWNEDSIGAQNSPCMNKSRTTGTASSTWGVEPWQVLKWSGLWKKWSSSKQWLGKYKAHAEIATDPHRGICHPCRDRAQRRAFCSCSWPLDSTGMTKLGKSPVNVFLSRTGGRALSTFGVTNNSKALRKQSKNMWNVGLSQMLHFNFSWQNHDPSNLVRWIAVQLDVYYPYYWPNISSWSSAYSSCQHIDWLIQPLENILQR